MDGALGKTWCTGGWDSGVATERLAERFPGAVEHIVEFRGERTVVLRADALIDVLTFLRDDAELAFDFLTDVTAVHYPGRAKPFDVVYLLYSFRRNARFRVTVQVDATPRVPSVVALWPTAGWLERECYDMFGVIFDGHPDLRRILMPEGFDGHPLRKEFALKC